MKLSRTYARSGSPYKTHIVDNESMQYAVSRDSVCFTKFRRYTLFEEIMVTIPCKISKLNYLDASKNNDVEKDSTILGALNKLNLDNLHKRINTIEIFGMINKNRFVSYLQVKKYRRLNVLGWLPRTRKLVGMY